MPIVSIERSNKFYSEQTPLSYDEFSERIDHCFMLSAYSLGVRPTCFLNTDMKCDGEENPSVSAISESGVPLRIILFDSAIFISRYV